MKAPGTTDLFALVLALAAGAPAAAQESEAFAAAARVIEARCVRCHSGPKPEGGLRLDAATLYRETVNVPSRAQSGMRVVDPARPDTSTLFRKLLTPGEGGYRGPRMPMHADALSQDELAQIRRWIESFPRVTWDGRAVAASAAPPAPPDGGAPVPIFQNGHLVNLPTPDTLGPKGLEFRILHRFKSAAGAAGSQNLWGLDGGAWISFGLAAALADDLDVGIRRTNLHQSWEGYAKWALVRQRDGGSPLSVALLGLGAHVSAENRANEDRLGAQAIVARRFGDRFSAMLVPTYVSRTHVFDAADTRGTWALGAGGEFRFSSFTALTGEWVTQLAGVAAPFESASIGLSIATSRHVFHLLLTNTSGAHTDQYAPGGDLDWSEGDFRLGFNITRTFDRSLFRRAPRSGEITP
jgi:mono/diheme cytochrome c family protein